MATQNISAAQMPAYAQRLLRALQERATPCVGCVDPKHEQVGQYPHGVVAIGSVAAFAANHFGEELTETQAGDVNTYLGGQSLRVTVRLGGGKTLQLVRMDAAVEAPAMAGGQSTTEDLVNALVELMARFEERGELVVALQAENTGLSDRVAALEAELAKAKAELDGGVSKERVTAVLARARTFLDTIGKS